MADNSIKLVQSTFSFYGLILSRQLATSLAKHLSTLEKEKQQPLVNQIAEQVLSLNLTSPHVTIDHIKVAIKECTRPDIFRDTETIINVINAFDFPKVRYDLFKGRFVLDQVVPDFFPQALYKNNIFKERFELLWHRTLKHKIFAPLKLGEDPERKVELVPLELLISESKQGECVTAMGLLTQLTEGQYYLEDPKGVVKIDLTETDFQQSIILEGSIVIAVGYYKDDVLVVSEIFLPPVERSSTYRIDFSNANTFGGSHSTSLKMSEKLEEYEKEHDDEELIFISDFWLDNPLVLDKFTVMLQGYSETPPIAFVICGHFLSFPPNITSAEVLQDGLKNLSNIIERFPSVRDHSKFIFVPGPFDLGGSKILPRHSLPKCLTEEFTNRVPNAIFTTNPCRIQYCTKEIVVLRENILSKICRNNLRYPKEGTLYQHFAKLITSQSHLTPWKVSVTPIHWKYDHTLQIYPTPDLIVVADQFEGYSTQYSNCHVINPGIFPRNEFSFQTYEPSTHSIKSCQIPNTIVDQ